MLSFNKICLKNNWLDYFFLIFQIFKDIHILKEDQIDLVKVMDNLKLQKKGKEIKYGLFKLHFLSPTSVAREVSVKEYKIYGGK